MIRKFNTRQLLIVLCVLAVVYLLQLTLQPNSQGNLPQALTQYSPSEIDQVEIWNSHQGDAPLTLSKKGNAWMVMETAKSQSFRADSNRVSALLNTLNNLKPIRLASTNKASWGSYNVTDSAGTRIKIHAQDKTVADLYIGRFSYTQSPMQAQMRQQNPYMQQNPGTMSTYVRMADKDKVFAVEGFLSSAANQGVSDFRDKSFLTLTNEADLQQLAFNYPADSSFVLSRKEDIWMMDEQPADSAKMAQYLSTLQNLKVRDFAATAAEKLPNRVQMTFADGSHITLQGILKNDTATLRSSQYPDIIGLDPSGSLFNRIFKGKNNFLK